MAALDRMYSLYACTQSPGSLMSGVVVRDRDLCLLEPERDMCLDLEWDPCLDLELDQRLERDVW